MTSPIVVFDTNVYRTLGVGRIADLRQRERRCDVVAAASFWTVLELCAHLAEPADTAFNYCMDALRSLWEHCVLDLDGRQVLPFAADSENQMAVFLFGKPIPGRDGEAQAYGFVVKELSTSADIQTSLRTLAPALRGIRVHRDSIEGHFAADMAAAIADLDQFARVAAGPGASDSARRKQAIAVLESGAIDRTLASALAEKAAHSVRVTLDSQSRNACVNAVIATHGTAIRFFRNVLRKCVESEIDLTVPKHANNVWDFQIACVVSHGASSEGRPLLLVSNERGIITAAEVTGNRSAVCTLPEYEVMLAACRFSCGQPNVSA